jgi:hypothetical protein
VTLFILILLDQSQNLQFPSEWESVVLDWAQGNLVQAQSRKRINSLNQTFMQLLLGDPNSALQPT